MNLRFSIITVCYNAEQTIFRLLDSVNQQSYNNIEHIIIDGSSNDGTLEIIKENISRFGLLISESDKGIYNAMNKGLRYATGDVIAFLNADDFYYNNKVIEDVNSYFTKDIKIVYGNIKYYNNKKNKPSRRFFSPGEYKKNMYLQGWHAPHPAFFCHKSCFEKYGGFNENLEVSSDFELMFRFQEIYKASSIYLNQTITYMSNDGVSSKLSSIIKGNLNIIKAFKINNKKVFIPLYITKRLFPKIINYLSN